MKIIYTSDLHGNIYKFEALKNFILSEKCDLVIIGGDIFEYTPRDINMQIDFAQNYLSVFLKDLNVPICLIKGNTDCSKAFGTLKSVVPENLKFLNDVPQQISEMFILGFSLVNISPFKIKNYERRDLLHDKVIFTPTLIRTDSGEIEEKPSDYLDSLPSIEEELVKYKCGTNDIFVCHAPPFGTKLDMVSHKSHVGSRAVYEFILKKQPLLMLCGHIHESAFYSNSHIDKIGKTICINPGQSERLHICVIQIEKNKVMDCKIRYVKIC